MQTTNHTAVLSATTESGARRAKTIADLNDLFRQGNASGRTLLTQGVLAEGSDFALRATRAVREFDNFTPENDPHGEHDFGAFEIDGETLFWKIDYYDLDYYDRPLECGSEDPANPDVTTRVLTLMLASEY